MKNKPPLHKINLKPNLTLDFEYEIRAETEEEARAIGMAHIVKAICAAFDCDPNDVNIKFEQEEVKKKRPKCFSCKHYLDECKCSG